MERLIQRTIQVGMVGAALLFLGTAARGHGGDESLVHACVNRGGQMRIVGASDGCHDRETALHWPRETAAEQKAPAPAGPKPLEVVDAQGVVLGPVVDLSGAFPIVGFRKDGITFALGVYGGGLFGFESVYFTGAGCTGTAYVLRSGAPLPTAAVDHLGRAYVDSGQPLALGVAVASSSSLSGCWPAGYVGDGAPAIMMFDTGAFQPPFTVR